MSLSLRSLALYLTAPAAPAAEPSYHRPLTAIPDNRRYQSLRHGVVIQTRGAARVSAEDASTFARPSLHVTVNNQGRIRTGQTRILPGQRRIGLADPKTLPIYLVKDADHKRRIRHALLLQTKGATRISATDAGYATPPSLFITDPDPRRRRIPGRILQTLGAHQAVGIADERTFPAMVLAARNHGRRGLIIRTLAGREAAAPPPEEITRALLLISDPDARRRYRAALAIRTNGAARISATDPRTQPALLVQDADHKRRLRDSLLIRTLGAEQAVGVADARTFPALTLTSRNHGRPGRVIQTKGAARVGMADERVLPLRVVTGERRNRPGIVQVSWPVKDEPVPDTGRTRPAMLVMGRAGRRAGQVGWQLVSHIDAIVPVATFLAGAPSTSFDAGAPTLATFAAGEPDRTRDAGAPTLSTFLAGEPDYTIS